MKKVIVLVVMLGLVAATIGSGALSAAKLYHRSVEANVRMDTGYPYLKFTPIGPNGDYVKTDPAGRVTFKIGANSAGGKGINPDSENWFSAMFMLTNLGTGDLNVWFESDNWRCKFYWGGNAPDVDGFADGQPNKPLITVGSSWSFGIYLDARGLEKGDSIDCEITILAE